MHPDRPNVLFIMTDQQRFDTIAALGNQQIHTPNLDRLVRRGISFSRAYSTCPVCIAARYTIRTGCEPPSTRVFSNQKPYPSEGQAEQMEERCGPYLAKVMTHLGYRTFGIGKFHTYPWNENLGYETVLRSEETYDATTRLGDDYALWLAREHPAFEFLEHLMGERTEMYYMPQRSPLPAALGVEAWTADRTVQEIDQRSDQRPYFGFVSFVGPHPPLAPPIPFNRAYHPDRMPSPIRGKVEDDHLDDEIPYMTHAVWADAVNDSLARVVKARYYGEISYIDSCLGTILDKVESDPEADNTLICFFSDHGDLMGDHHGWQKQNFFEGSCRVPFLLSWPRKLPAAVQRSEVVTLADLFGLATRAAGSCETREGIDLLGLLAGETAPRSSLVGMADPPGSQFFKVMVIRDNWKYIFMANGGREQLFDLNRDPGELSNCLSKHGSVRDELYAIAVEMCQRPGAEEALEGTLLRSFPFQEKSRQRIYQFDRSKGAKAFPQNVAEMLQNIGSGAPSLAATPAPVIPQEAESLGIGLKAGMEHYRAFVGPPGRYDIIAAMTFNLLTSIGLRQHHSLLDLGCGSLRAGRLFIPYLNCGKYYGVEPNEWLVREGIRREMGADLIAIKNPTFLYTDSPNELQRLKVNFDFVVAQSIFSHCGLNLITPWLAAIASRLTPAGAILATFVEGERDSAAKGWIYPGCVEFTQQTMREEAEKVQLKFQILDWQHPSQKWALFAQAKFDDTWFQEKPLTWNTLLDHLPNK
ncbi:MAG: sulfatase-like hydrolase/transferase [Chthoniobacterales bacterium]